MTHNNNKNKNKISIDELLNNFSYTELEQYVPGVFSLMFVNFIKMVNGGEGEESKTPVMHLKMIDQLANGDNRLANMIFRGGSKTSVFAEYLFLYLAVYREIPGFGEVELALYVSDSVDNGVKNLRKNVEFRYENSDFLKKYLPKANITDQRMEFINIENKRFIVKSYGVLTGVRGVKEQGKRPVLAVIDDVVSDEEAKSAASIKRIENTIYSAVDYALHPKRNMIIWSGTPFNQNDPLYKAIESGAWTVNVFPVCEQFPCEREDFKGAWEDRFNYDYILEKYNFAKSEGKLASFNQELMLRIMGNDERIIQDEDIQWYNRASLLRNKDNFLFYITTDFATKASERNDLSVISVWAVSNGGQFFWVDGLAKHQLMDQNLDDLFLLVSKYKPYSVGIETSGQQGGFIPWIREQMINRNIFFTLATKKGSKALGITSNISKIERFDLVQPWFKQQLMHFPNELRTSAIMKEAMNELTLATVEGFRSKHDDFIDTISQLAMMEIHLPSMEETMNKNNEGIWDLDSGIHSHNNNSLNSYIV